MQDSLCKSPISVLIPCRNEEKNLPACLSALRWVDEVVVVDSQSNDRTIEIAESSGARVLQFCYKGGWPKKRQWALDTFEFRNEWILLLDSDEIIPPSLQSEIADAISKPDINGYYLLYRVIFLGRLLNYGDNDLWKLSLFRRGKGKFEKRLEEQDQDMGDVEVHEHIVVDGKTGRLKHPVRHENVNSLSRYIQKHNEYSNWEAKIHFEARQSDAISPKFLGTQAQRRRWLKHLFMEKPGTSIWLFFYKYFLRLGFLDGIPGLIYCGFQGIYIFQVKAKIREWKLKNRSSRIGF